MSNLHKGNPYNQVGYKGLDETFDCELLNEMNDHLDIAKDMENQHWVRVEADIHARFDRMFGCEEVARHINKFKGIK